MKLALLLTALFATVYATAAFIAGMDADFEVSAVLAVLALGGVIWLEERDWKRRRVIAQTWERRDREAGES